MVAYSFKQRFVAPIEAGTKTQTIRAYGKRRHARIGDTLQLYFGMRTRHCRLIATATCHQVGDVRLQFFPAGPPHFAVDGRALDGGERERFARADGFASEADMVRFWREVHADTPDFRGIIIGWSPE